MNEAAPSMEQTAETETGLDAAAEPTSPSLAGRQLDVEQAEAEQTAMLPFAFARRFSIVITGQQLAGNKADVACKGQPSLTTLAEVRRLARKELAVRQVGETFLEVHWNRIINFGPDTRLLQKSMQFVSSFIYADHELIIDVTIFLLNRQGDNTVQSLVFEKPSILPGIFPAGLCPLI